SFAHGELSYSFAGAHVCAASQSISTLGSIFSFDFTVSSSTSLLVRTSSGPYEQRPSPQNAASTSSSGPYVLHAGVSVSVIGAGPCSPCSPSGERSRV